MRKVTLGLALLSLLTAPLNGHSAEIPDAYVYIGWPLDDVVILNRPTATDPNPVLENGPGDAIAALRFCDQASPFDCFVSVVYTFSVPKQWRPEVKSWQFEGYRFDVIKDGLTAQFFGCSTSDVALIRADSKLDSESGRSDEFFYYFSRTHGLLGFGFIPALSINQAGPKDVVTHGGVWLANTLGFGATITEADAWPDCRQPPSRKARQE